MTNRQRIADNQRRVPKPQPTQQVPSRKFLQTAYEKSAKFRAHVLTLGRLMEITKDPSGIIWERYLVTRHGHVMDFVVYSSYLGCCFFIQPQTSPFWNGFISELEIKRHELIK